MNKPTRTFSYSDQGYDSEQKSRHYFVSVSSMVPVVHSDQVAPYMVIPPLPRGPRTLQYAMDTEPTPYQLT